MHAKLNLNLQPVKSTYHLGPKSYYINIVVLGIVKNLFKRYITIFILYVLSSNLFVTTYTKLLAKYSQPSHELAGLYYKTFSSNTID